MIGRKGLIAGLVLASAFATANVVVAGTPIGGIVVKGGCNPSPNDPCPHKSTKIDNISVQLDLTRAETWIYDPARGTLATSTARRLPVPGAVPGVGIVVKANSARGAAMTVPVGEDGRGRFPSLEDGTYDVVIRVPNAAFSTRPRDGGERGIELTFTIVKRGDSVVSLTKRRDSRKGAGSPKAAGF
jgi:ABC-type amino acid transport substrate-binding protein